MSALALPEGRVRASHVLRLAWPVLVSMLSYTTMNLADTLFTGWLGTAELAAVGLSTTLVFFVLTPARGLLRGVKIDAAQRTGARDDDGAVRLLAQGIWLSLLLGALVMALAPIGPWLFAALGASEDVLPHADAYFAIRVLFAPLATLAWTIEGWFQARGDTRTPMVATLVGNGLNVVLDPILIFGLGPIPALGVAGASWATVVAIGTMFAILAWRAARHLPWTHWGLRWALVWRVLVLGVPLAVQWTLNFGGFLVFLGLLARAGDAHLAAHVLVFRIVHVSVLPGFALADAAGVLVGQAIGARRARAARQSWLRGTTLAIGLMAAAGVVFLVAPDALLWPFGPEPEVVAIAVPLLALAAAFQVFDAIAMVNFNALTAAGDTRISLFVFVGGSWLVQVPISIALVGYLEWGAIGAWIALAIEIAAVALVSLLRIQSRAWLEARIGDEAEEAAESDESLPVPALAAS